MKYRIVKKVHKDGTVTYDIEKKVLDLYWTTETWTKLSDDCFSRISWKMNNYDDLDTAKYWLNKVKEKKEGEKMWKCWRTCSKIVEEEIVEEIDIN